MTVKLALLLAPILLIGCKTYQSPEFKPAPAAPVTAEAALKAWCEYKDTPRFTPAQVASVKTAWDNYLAAIHAEQSSAKTNSLSKAHTRNISLTSLAAAKVVQAVMASLPPEKAAELK